MSHDNTNTARKGSSPLPFAGLGFDLSPVRTRAFEIRMVFSSDDSVHFSCGIQNIAPLSGYRLQVRLGTEIRGR